MKLLQSKSLRRGFGFQRRKQVTRWWRPVGGAGGGSLPGMRLDALQNPRGQGDGVAAFLATDFGFGAGRHATNEMFQFGRQRVAAVWRKVQNLKMSAEELVFERGPAGGIELSRVQPGLANMFGRLNQ